jgi:hypothetical protein
MPWLSRLPFASERDSEEKRAIDAKIAERDA